MDVFPSQRHLISLSLKYCLYFLLSVTFPAGAAEFIPPDTAAYAKLNECRRTVAKATKYYEAYAKLADTQLTDQIPLDSALSERGISLTAEECFQAEGQYAEFYQCLATKAGQINFCLSSLTL